MMLRILYLTIVGLILETMDAPAAMEPGVTRRAPDPAKHDAYGHQDESVEARTGNPLWGVPVRQLSATRDRPVFSPSRRPPPPPVVTPAIAFTPPPVAPKPAEPARPPLDLIGTVIGEHERLAVFVEQTTKVLVRLRLEETYQGWTIRSIQYREATFEHDRTTAVVALPPPSTPTPWFATAPKAASSPPTPPPVATGPVPRGTTTTPKPVPSAAPPPSLAPAPDAASQGLAALFGKPRPFEPSPSFAPARSEQAP